MLTFGILNIPIGWGVVFPVLQTKIDVSFFLAVTITLLTGIISFLQPNQMWYSTKYYEMMFESQLFMFRCKFGDYSDSKSVATVIDNYKLNIFNLEKDMLGMKPLNKIHRISLKNKL